MLHSVPPGSGDEKLAARARRAESACASRALRGRRVALLTNDPTSESAIAFSRAAEELGAQVAVLPVRPSDWATPRDIAETARVLSMLYDAVEFQGVPSEFVEALRLVARIPVRDESTSVATPAPLSIDMRPELLRLRLMQAALLDSLNA